jgi:hypothetical protein
VLLERLRGRTGGDVWVLIPADDQADLPTVDGAAISVPTPNEWVRVPRACLFNVHRAA